MNVTNELDNFIAAHNGSVRDALNVALMRLVAAEERVHQLRAMLFDEIEEPAQPKGDASFWRQKFETEIEFASGLRVALQDLLDGLNQETEYGPYGAEYVYKWTGDDWSISNAEYQLNAYGETHPETEEPK